MSSRTGKVVWVILACLSFECGGGDLNAQKKSPNKTATETADSGNQGGVDMTFSITSPAFDHEGKIPVKYTCVGEDVSVPLEWTGVPEGTKSLSLIVDDPDAPDPAAPKMVWVHWVLYDMPTTAAGLEENVSALPAGTLEGVNDWKRTGWGGPCPPIGRHRYYFKLFALDAMLPDLKSPTKKALLAAMEGHVIGNTELMGTFEK